MNNFGIKYSKKKKFNFFSNKIKAYKNEIIIEVKSCGVCGSDYKILMNGSKRVKNGRIMGHEIAGLIKFVGKNIKNFKQGYSIALGADIENIEKKDLAFGHEIDGGFQKYLKFNCRLLKNIPYKVFKNKINYYNLSLTEPLACCLNGFENIKPEPKKNYVIFGAGSIGLLLSKLALHFKAKNIILVDNNVNKIKNFKNTKKMQICNFKSCEKKIINKFGKNAADYIFVACNSFAAQKKALSIVKQKGTINFFAGISKNRNVNKIDTNLIHYKEIKVVGSHGSKKHHINEAARLIQKKIIKVDDIISHKINVKDFNYALNLMKTKKSNKIVINFNE